MNAAHLWKQYQRYFCFVRPLGLAVDVSRISFDDGFLERMAQPIERVLASMDALEHGAIANPDENRMVGHYWLRAPELAPSSEIAGEIGKTVADVKAFAAAVHSGNIRPPTTNRFEHVLSIGIGG